jgi:hypothetical protein
MKDIEGTKSAREEEMMQGLTRNNVTRDIAASREIKLAPTGIAHGSASRGNYEQMLVMLR